MSDGSIASFLDKVEVSRVEGGLPREFGAARLLYETQGSGPAVIFRVEGAEQDSAGNLVDTRRKLYTAIGCESDIEAYNKLLDSISNPESLKEVGAPRLREARRGLLSLPASKFYEKEAGLYLSATIAVACYENVCNASIHRVLVSSEYEARVRIVPRHLWRLYSQAVSREGRLPVTFILGVHPAIVLASATSPALGVFELGLASRILSGLEIYRSPIHGNPVPYGAGAVIEGWLTSEMAEEGPYVDALMTYDRVRSQPVLKVEKVYIQPDNYTHVILGGGYEHALLMGFPREASIWESVSRVVPRVHKVRLTPASGGWLHALISVDKLHDGDGKNAIMAAFSAHPSLKHVVVVDGDVDVDRAEEVEWAIATRFQADRDLIVIRRARGSTLDPSGENGLVSKMGLDATKPLAAGLSYERGVIPGVK